MATGASEASLHACGLDAAESGALGQLARRPELSSAALCLRWYKRADVGWVTPSYHNYRRQHCVYDDTSAHTPFEGIPVIWRRPPSPGMATGLSEASLHACELHAAESGAL